MDITNQKLLQYNSSREVFLAFRSKLAGISQERLIALFFSNRLQLVKETILAIGDHASVEIHPMTILRAAMQARSPAVILLHNHPSGKPRPSHTDDQMTKIIATTGKEVGLSLLDHIIIGRDSYFSYFDNNYILDRSHHFALQPYKWMHDLLIKNYL